MTTALELLREQLKYTLEVLDVVEASGPHDHLDPQDYEMLRDEWGGLAKAYQAEIDQLELEASR